jgi:glycosyltransferase involved in cell wall biosynthesis
MQRSPEVTVLMGVFNGLPELERSIRSILAQTFTDFEFLIVDDASTDGSDELIRRYARQDGRIRLLRNESNAGLGAVLHQGVREARGGLVARMDADDISVPTRLETQVAFFRQHPQTDIVGSYALDVGRDGAVLRERRVPTSHEKIVELIWSNPFIHTSVMFRKESIVRVGSYRAALRRRQDYDLWFRCAHAGLRFANIPEPLVHYHFSEETLRRNHIRAAWDQARIGVRGCRLVHAPLHAYIATCMPLIEAMMPNFLRLKLAALKARIDPRATG